MNQSTSVRLTRDSLPGQYRVFSADSRRGKEPDYNALVPMVCDSAPRACDYCRALEREGYTVWKVETPDGRTLTRDCIESAIEQGAGALEAVLDRH